MSEINLTYCPEGGEHEWEMWYDDDEAELVIDCDRCHNEPCRAAFRTETLKITLLPVRLEQLPHTDSINVHSRPQV